MQQIPGLKRVTAEVAFHTESGGIFQPHHCLGERPRSATLHLWISLPTTVYRELWEMRIRYGHTCESDFSHIQMYVSQWEMVRSHCLPSCTGNYLIIRNEDKLRSHLRKWFLLYMWVNEKWCLSYHHVYSLLQHQERCFVTRFGWSWATTGAHNRCISCIFRCVPTVGCMATDVGYPILCWGVRVLWWLYTVP